MNDNQRDPIRERRKRNIALALGLVALVVLFFVMTLERMASLPH
jgi:hypothetical protein